MTHPISWLRMERYHLGELAGEELAAVEGHLAECDECRSMLAELEGDERPLPTLAVEPVVVRGPARWWASAGLLLAMAAAALLLVRPPELPPAELPPAEVAVKGGPLAIELVRERAGLITERPDAYADGDRIQVRVTCPSGTAEVAVLQGRDLAWPLEPVACGNRVVAGAVLLTGGQDTAVCAVSDRAAVSGRDLGEAACVVLRGE